MNRLGGAVMVLAMGVFGCGGSTGTSGGSTGSTSAASGPTGSSTTGVGSTTSSGSGTTATAAASTGTSAQSTTGPSGATTSASGSTTGAATSTSGAASTTGGPAPSVSASTLGILVNLDDPQSVEVAAYYQSVRHIPANHVFAMAFDAGGGDILDLSTFAPIKAALDADAGSDVQVFAVTWTFPFIVSDDAGCQMAITSAFALGYDEKYCVDAPIVCGVTAKDPYFQSTSTAPFTDYGIRPTMMIAGDTAASAEALIDRGVASDGTAPVCFAELDITTDPVRSVRAPEFEQLKNSWDGGLLTIVLYDGGADQTNSGAIENATSVMFYLTGLADTPGLATNQYLPGAIGDALTSFGGILSGAGQTTLLDWLNAGVTASEGTVREPCNNTQKFSNATVLIPDYYSGQTLIEAYWKSVETPGEGLFVGEPLARPFQKTSVGHTDPCALSARNSSCGTTYDCLSGLLCIADGGTTSCQPPVGNTRCAPNGATPTATVPCCESALDAGGLTTCGPFVACALTNNACSTSADCCAGLTCSPSSHTCLASCGSYGTTCTADADCCAGEGVVCTPGTLFNPPLAESRCYGSGLPVQLSGGLTPCLPLAMCAAFDAGPNAPECQLDALCDLWLGLDAGTGDPCAADGLVCNTAVAVFTPAGKYGVCSQPSTNQTCIQGGPACQPFANSTAPVDCEDDSDFGTSGYSCLQSCARTADCIDPSFDCVAVEAPSLCYFNTCGAGAVGGSAGQFYNPCPAEGQSDGLCAPLGAYGDPAGDLGLCLQAALDGGGPGSACLLDANRQIGGFCDNLDVCSAGICGSVCNPGTGGTPSCTGGQICVPAYGYWETHDAQDFGGCVTACDFTQLSGGSCGLSSANVPTKCIPAEELDYGPYTGTPIIDFCSPLAANPIPIGDPCSDAPVGVAIDPCVQGAMCLSPTGAAATCLALCEDAQIGHPCAAGGTCTAINVTGTPSTHTGVCVLP